MKRILFIAVVLVFLAGCGPGNITITTNPPGASVFINGRHVGTSPVQTPNPMPIITVPELHIKAEREGYFPYEIIVPLQYGKRTAHHIEMIPQPGTIDRIASAELLSQIFGLSLWFNQVREMTPLWSRHVYEPALDALLSGLEDSAIALANRNSSIPPDTIYKVEYELIEITPTVVISRPRLGSTVFGKDAHLMLVREQDSWSVLLPGFAFGDQGAPEPIAYHFADIRSVFSLDELIELAVNQRLGRTTNTGRLRYIKSRYDDGVLEIHLNGDLSYGVNTAYRERLTLTARNDFAYQAASVLRDTFLAAPKAQTVTVVFHAPVFVDQFGSVEHLPVGVLSMSREVYEQIVWETITPSMVVELLEIHWFY